MGADGHVRRLPGQGGVEHLDVGQMLVFAVQALGVHVFALGRIVQIGEGGVVHLQIAAAQPAERLDLFGVDRAEVVPELLDVGVDVRVDDVLAAPVVHHARRWDRELGHALGHDRFEELEILAEDALLILQLADDAQGRGGEFDAALVVVELDFQVVLDLLDPAELVEEIHVPGAAAVFAVGDSQKAEILLQLHGLANRLVLGGPELGLGDLALLIAGAGVQQLGRAQEAAHMIGAERGRAHARGVVHFSSPDRLRRLAGPCKQTGRSAQLRAAASNYSASRFSVAGQ